MNSVDYSAEQHFVQSFIRENRRERLLYELTTPEKRYDGVSRFCHQAQVFLDPAKIIMEGEDLDRRNEFERFVRQHDELCLTLSPDFWMDEQFLPLKDAVRQAAVCPTTMTSSRIFPASAHTAAVRPTVIPAPRRKPVLASP